MIRRLEAADLDAFVAHAEEQAAENGRGATVRFALRAPGAARDLARVRQALEEGLPRRVGESGWFRVWIAEEPPAIVAHVGLRAPAEPRSAHRAMVDVGVLESHRRRGLATGLYEAAIAWASNQEQLAWLDAEVFAHNAPALALHRRLGFVETARVPDLFRLDGAPVDDVRLSLRLRPRSS